MILKKSLGEILTEMGVTSKKQLSQALERQKEVYGTKAVKERLQRFAMVAESRETEDIDSAPMLGQILTDMDIVTRERFRKSPGRFDLVMTDMTMPQMTGDRLAAEIMKIRPDIPVILCTGFSHQMTEKKAKQLGIKAFLMKPLVLRDLASTIRGVLDENKA